MPAERTRKVQEVKERLLTRLRHGYLQPGDRFLSIRTVAEMYGISYQTAHRLVAELCDEGTLERRPKSGTYLPGGTRHIHGAQLVFHQRATKALSFGAKLLSHLSRRLDVERIDWTVSFVGDEPCPPSDRLPVIWESKSSVAECARLGRSAVLINDRPAVGMESLFIDSVSTDDFSGGACAAQLLQSHTSARRGFAVVAGPEGDERSARRVAGFLSVQKAAVVSANGWYFDQAILVAEQAVARGTRGIFCCGDQLAAAVVRWCDEQGRARPQVVGFDDAPVAETLNLTTIGIPWEELAAGVAQVVKRRLSGDRGASSHQMFQPRPVIRG